jgi:hypothetical protein
MAAPTRGELGAAVAIVLGCVVLVLVVRPLSRRLAARPTAAQCTELFQRRAEQVARAQGGVTRSDGDGGPPAAATPEAIARCVQTLTAEDARCALAASGADEFERCLTP